MIEPVFAEGGVELYAGDARVTLAELPEGCCQMAVCSPPYYSLRHYQTTPLVWDEDPGCIHEWNTYDLPEQRWGDDETLSEKQQSNAGSAATVRKRKGPSQAQGSTSCRKGRSNVDEVRQIGFPEGMLCVKCGAMKCDLGLEPTPEDYIRHLVEVFEGVKRTLHDTGLLFVNIADSRSGSGKGRNRDGTHAASCGDKQVTNKGTIEGRIVQTPAGGPRSFTPAGYPQGSLLQIPARFSLEMQAAGWILRSAIVLPKPSPMTQSMKGPFWAKHRRKVKPGALARQGDPAQTGGWEPHRGDIRNKVTQSDKQAGHGPTYDGFNARWRGDEGANPEWEDCPGCRLCEPNGGLVLRWGGGRPTDAYELLYVFSKTERFFWSTEAVRRPLKPESIARDRRARWTESNRYDGRGDMAAGGSKAGAPAEVSDMLNPNGGNAHNVLWDREQFPELADLLSAPLDVLPWKPSPTGEQHFACFPIFLPLWCVKAGTPEWICPTCGSPWAPVIEYETHQVGKRGDRRAVTAEETGRADGYTYVPDTSSTAHFPTAEEVAAWKRACGADSEGEYHGRAVKDYASAGAQNASDVKRNILAGMEPKAVACWLPTCKCKNQTPARPCVLDLFAGSGTTGVAAIRLNRRAILCELNSETYTPIIVKRLTEALVPPELRAHPGQLTLDTGAVEPLGGGQGRLQI